MASRRSMYLRVAPSSAAESALSCAIREDLCSDLFRRYLSVVCLVMYVPPRIFWPQTELNREESLSRVERTLQDVIPFLTKSGRICAEQQRRLNPIRAEVFKVWWSAPPSGGARFSSANKAERGTTTRKRREANARAEQLHETLNGRNKNKRGRWGRGIRVGYVFRTGLLCPGEGQLNITEVSWTTLKICLHLGEKTKCKKRGTSVFRWRARRSTPTASQRTNNPLCQNVLLIVAMHSLDGHDLAL